MADRDLLDPVDLPDQPPEPLGEQRSSPIRRFSRRSTRLMTEGPSGTRMAP